MKSKTKPESNAPEYLLIAAIQHKGDIITGYRHGDCVDHILDHYDENYKYNKMAPTVGFLTSKNRFVNRFEAFAIARQQHQIWHKLHEGVYDNFLTSEDLY